MASFKVICITKPNVNSSHEHITHIGYYDSNLKKVIITVKDAIKRIDANSLEFYVQTGSDKAYVKVVRVQGHEAFIKTIPDNTKRDNLLSLPQC
ncbi:putative FlaG/YvyC family protein [Pedobacter cryoconitis]|uniref:Putative FlaG/YvyC family protein n=1 Tax=Pedobacter cryoconitis TaxID=188932 RepID=A0A7W8ZK27_9SPHI|nr:DUF3892 domain-containing protein [Pedobacter cryoconitis]MBB5635312.1 putative FlaG/YvyC family protein [Pedobacter cryoconitis]